MWMATMQLAKLMTRVLLLIGEIVYSMLLL